jgi:hypothetical protein
MKNNYFVEFDKILADRVQKLEDYGSKYNYLKSEAKDKISSIYYGKNSFQLGYFCPSLIIDKITKNFKRDKLGKTLSKNNKGFVSYELDINGKLLRLNEVNSFGTVFETYLIRNQNEEYSITFLNGNPLSIIDSVRVLYENNKVVRCDFIGSSSLWSEIYDYKKISQNIIYCTQYYYVPGLIDSDKSNKAGKLNSPMKQFEIKINIDSFMKIKRLEYGELINGKIIISYVYEE